MKLYKTLISPKSSFATPLKGDTLFGQMCWIIRYRFGEQRLNELLSVYDTDPFMVVSDGFVKGFVPKPKLPSYLLGEDPKEKKINRKKIWLTLEDLQNGNFKKAKTAKMVGEDQEVDVVRNSINYLEFKTSGDEFAPYSVKEFFIGKKDIYFLIDENLFTKKELIEALSLLGEFGFGKDTTLGKGRFEIETIKDIDLNFCGKAFMTLAPCDIEGYEKCYYETFVKFGKLGADRAHTNPFKKPLLLADTGAVVFFEEEKESPFIGKAIKNIATFDDVVHQGYAITIPIGVNHEEI